MRTSRRKIGPMAAWLLLTPFLTPCLLAQPWPEAARAAEDLLIHRPGIEKADEDCVLQPLLCGQVVETTLTTRDCSFDDGTYGDLWLFPAYHSQGVGVAVRPNGFDVVAGLIDPAGRILGVDAAPSGSIASFGAVTRTPGDHAILVFSEPEGPGVTGTYRMALVCDSGRCVRDAVNLCMLGNRFRVQVAWENQYDGSKGFGRAIRRSDAAGFFSFGDPSNVELLVKILDFGGGVYKVFYGQLTDLHFMMAVTDTVTGETRTYENTPGDCGGIDQSFAASTAALKLAGAAASATGTCVPGRNALCLLDRRFRVEVDWRNQYSGQSGNGGSTSLSNLTGAFYFTEPAVLELLVKAVPFQDRVALFYGTLSDLEYTIRITDTLTGTVKTYSNPAGKYCGGLDNTGFPPR